jgi:hypothetical protein
MFVKINVVVLQPTKNFRLLPLLKSQKISRDNSWIIRTMNKWEVKVRDYSVSIISHGLCFIFKCLKKILECYNYNLTKLSNDEVFFG